NSFINNSSPSADARLFASMQFTNTLPNVAVRQLANIGTSNPAWIKDMISHTRGEAPQILNALPAGVTDLRFFRVVVHRSTVGIHLLGGGVSPTPTPPPQ